MNLKYIKEHLKPQSFCPIAKKVIRFIGWIFFVKIKCKFLKFIEWPMDRSVLERCKVNLRVISPDEVNLLSEHKYYSKKIWDDRWRQGAEFLGAVWNGKIVEYCWIISNRCYRDIGDGFYIKLNPGECYLFDYRALKGKPDELRHYRIMKVLVQFIFHLMKNRFPNCKNICYVAVEENNEKPLFFFKRYFHAEFLTDVIAYKFFFWRWSKYKKARELKRLLTRSR